MKILWLIALTIAFPVVAVHDDHARDDESMNAIAFFFSKPFLKYSLDWKLQTNINRLISDQKLDFAIYPVTTKDGYILNMYRILPPGKVAGTKPILMMHGTEGSAMDFLLNKDKSPAVVLAKKGYDVWLGNQRGNYFSLGHETLSYKKGKYWEFYQETIAEHDVPMMISTILRMTGAAKIAAYIGYEQGSLVFLQGASLNPLFFNSQVDYFVALNPQSIMFNNIGPFLSFFKDLYGWFLSII